MEALSREETRAYVRHRLKVAGSERECFSAEAVELIHSRTTGVPRLINQVCDTALVYAFGDQRPFVDVEIVAQVLDDRRAGGLLALGDSPPPKVLDMPAAIGAER